MSFNGARRLLRPEVLVADWTEVVLKDPICDTDALSSGSVVRMAVVDTDVHTRVDDLALRLREAVKERVFCRAFGFVVVI